MNMTLFYGCICFFFIVYAVAEAMGGSKKPLRKSAAGMVHGGLLLLAFSIAEPLTGVRVTLSFLTILTALIGGIPGAVLVVLLNAFF